MVFALQGGELDDFTKKSAKGLRYREDIFCSVYTYSLGSDEIRVVVNSFIEHMLTQEEGKKPYMNFLQKNHLHGEVRSQFTMPGFFDRLEEISKHDVYKRLVFHIPASDLLDLLEVEQGTRILFAQLTEGVSEESGSSLYFILNKGKIALLHTIFT
ncbi:MAG: hypothetical protein KKG59_03945 [Nanoarchaeota archaeon]|nr:hypothetical protein [Nanoarchaeota archaeon]